MRLTTEDIERMTGTLFLSEDARPRSRRATFWTLLVLASVIASAGVVADSTATVIGAMIVAPLMTPIVGTALAVVLNDHRNLVASALLVAAGAAAVVATGYAVGLLDPLDVLAENNSQVAGRVAPRLIDLVAALATGAVGAFALVRRDVSDALPGVAIAISLVPPLAVVGLTLESDAPRQAGGALLLFATNVAAIVATGTMVFLFSGVRGAARRAGREVGDLRGLSLLTVVAAVVVVAVPLGLSSARVIWQETLKADAAPVAERWAQEQGWAITGIGFRQSVLWIEALGPPPEADPATLRDALDEAGLRDVDVEVSLVIGGTRRLPGG
ncbi:MULTISPECIES: DUF389 domain-containing protein [Rhodococcus]|uniref:Integral membrane protein n=1 Tax=Rhodococcus rhodochrous KG-21 TaxID=1441923 RepID=A0A0M9WPE3_RHORH|nr:MULTISPECIES: DUF389 domain-containing protein [Rhodococcus]KOS56581.1 hypothetical protein Z051_08940 [Rhodococcus rhodochrous KG-21]